jgi:protein-S-isoprenylcysteine O-methyltransferase Ste14
MAKQRITFQGILILGGSMLALFCSNLIVQRWSNEIFEEPLDILGVGLILFGFIWRIASRGHKADHSANGHVLIEDGPYALCRNPMYFGTLMIGMGIISLLFDAVALIIFTSAYLFIYIQQIKEEEAVLSAHFGAVYARYCARVPRFFPNVLSCLQWPHRLKIKAPWIKKEIVSLLSVLGAVLLVEIWIDVGLFGGHKFYAESIEIIGVVAVYAAVFGLLFFFAPRKSINRPASF